MNSNDNGDIIKKEYAYKCSEEGCKEVFILSTELSDHLKKVHNKEVHPWSRIGKVIINTEDGEEEDEDE